MHPHIKSYFVRHVRSRYVQLLPCSHPLQAGKLTVVIATLGFGILGYTRLIPDQQLTALLLVPFVSLCLAFVITGETLLTGFRMIRADKSVISQLSIKPAYTGVRILEASVALLATVGIVVVIVVLPDEQMAGPGAIGLLFILTALGVLILSTSLIRTLTECYFHQRRDRPAVGTTNTH